MSSHPLHCTHCQINSDWKLFVLDRNTWNYITVCKLFVLDGNTWNYITVCKLLVLDWNTCYIYIYQPLRSGRIWHKRSIFKQSLTGLNSEFSFSKTGCLIRAEEPTLPYYLPIAGGRIIGFIPFPRVLVLCEMQSTSSSIWTRITVSISYDDNHYTTYLLYNCMQTTDYYQVGIWVSNSFSMRITNEREFCLKFPECIGRHQF